MPRNPSTTGSPKPRNAKVPDLAYWLPGRPTGDEIFVPPTLAIVIACPGETMESQRAKCREYLSAGIDLAWLVDPDTRTVECFEAAVPGSRLAVALDSPLLPGFHIPIAELFTDLT